MVDKLTINRTPNTSFTESYVKIIYIHIELQGDKTPPWRTPVDNDDPHLTNIT